MAEITSYPTATPKSGDYLLGAQVGEPGANPATPTKKFTVGSVSGTPSNNGILFNHVGMDITWQRGDNTAYVQSSRVGTGYTDLIYPKLYISFDNLDLESGSTYSLLMERFKPYRTAQTNGLTVYKPASFKRMSNAGAAPPFDQRVFELPITTTSGEYFDFKFDLYYSSGGFGFPAPSGFGGKGSFDNKTKQYLAFRIIKKTNGQEEISPIIEKLIMIGVKEEPASGIRPSITFAPY